MSDIDKMFDFSRLFGQTGKLPYFAGKVPALKWLVGLGFLLMMTVFVLGTNYAVTTSQVSLAYAQSLFNGLYLIMSALFYLLFSRHSAKWEELDVSAEIIESYDAYESDAKESAFSIAVGFLLCFGMMGISVAISGGLFVLSTASIFGAESLWGTVNSVVIGISESLFYVLALPRFFYGLLTVKGSNLRLAPFLSIIMSSMIFGMLHYASPYYATTLSTYLINLIVFNMIGCVWFAISGDILGVVYGHAFNDVVGFGLNPTLMLVMVVCLVVVVLMKAEGDAFKGVEIAQ